MLSTWSSFYVLIGSAAATLTGLMFVVITLVSNEKPKVTRDGVSTFSTPTVFHFCSVLFTAAFMSIPFRSIVPIAILLSLTGASGVVYILRIALRTLRLQTYVPDAEDWTWHVSLPLAAYVAMLIAAGALHAAASLALYAPAAAATLLIFVGIHNAWDNVTFLAIGNPQALPEQPANGAASGAEYASDSGARR